MGGEAGRDTEKPPSQVQEREWGPRPGVASWRKTPPRTPRREGVEKSLLAKGAGPAKAAAVGLDGGARPGAGRLRGMERSPGCLPRGVDFVRGEPGEPQTFLEQGPDSVTEGGESPEGEARGWGGG